MSYGLKVLNANLALQIDSTYTNYALHEHGENVTTETEVNVGNHKIVTFSSATLQAPLIAIKPSSSVYCGLMRYIKSGNNYIGFDIFADITAYATFSWQSFIPPITKSAVAYGLRVYNASEVLVFDSGHIPMIISDVDTANPVYDAVQTITHPSDSNAYYIVSPWGRILHTHPGQEYSEFFEYIAMLKSLSATQVSFGGGLFSDDPFAPPDVDGTWGFWPTLWTIITVKKAF